MTEREEIIKALEICTSQDDIERCIADSCPYLGGSTEGTCIDNLLRDVFKLVRKQEEHFSKWANDIGAHFCTTCTRKDCDCPIENEYALPRDGYCHLWDGAKEQEAQD